MRASLRPLIWEALRRVAATGADITAPRVRDVMCVSPLGVLERIRDYLRALTRAGYLAEVPADVAGGPGAYRLVNDCGHEAPRVRADGSPVLIGLGRERMWHVMRVLKTFSAAELAIHCSVDDHVVATTEARDYCQRLARCGFLRPVSYGRWTLVPARWRGPQPPQVRRDKSIRDPNTGAVYGSDGQEVRHD